MSLLCECTRCERLLACDDGDGNVLLIVLRPFQTELLPRCLDVPPVARLLQEDGKLLIQALLEVWNAPNVVGHHFPQKDHNLSDLKC